MNNKIVQTELGLSKIFEQLLRSRGIDRDFLEPKYEDSVDPFLLLGMHEAVERIREAARKKEKVLIYGDYDVDGVTATTVMRDTLTLAGISDVATMLPNRFLDGYGMSRKVVDRAVSEGVKLVVTVDCGSRNHEIIEELRANGIDVIVTDHHECAETLPDAIAVINPKRADADCVELRDLAGVGVAFKVAQALVREGLIPEGQEKWLLDLVLIGTICDSMQLTGENRRLCKFGMKVLGKTRRVGLKELMRAAGTRDCNGEAIGFQIGPRLNAAGRMETADKALELLMTKRRVRAAELAMELCHLNQERRKQQEAALEEIRERGVRSEPVIIEQGEWHEGVLGIIAGRLTEEYRRPVFVLTETNGALKGSGRSFGDFSLAEALGACAEQIVGGGGHKEACGVKILPEKLEEFREAINRYYKGLRLTGQEKYLQVQEDVVIRELSELSLEVLEEIKTLEPFGAGNEEPIFLLSDMLIADLGKLGADGQHLRLSLLDKTGKNFKVMSFSAPEEYLRLEKGERVNVWIRLVENEFRGLRSVEGRILGVKAA